MPSSTRYPRHGENGGFDRVVYFTDAVFAIAMTLLVVEIGVPDTIEGAAEDPAAMLGALGDKGPLIFAFFLGCYVIGSYWAAHHRFMTWLAAVDRGFVALTVVYLSFVALLPFPTGVLGEFGDNPISAVRALAAGGLCPALAGDPHLAHGAPAPADLSRYRPAEAGRYLA
jgi:uncharacterized membrane protein